MIIFELACGGGHRFEGWFASAADFDRQCDATLVQCPLCNDTHIVKIPSAKVRVGKDAPPPASAAPSAAVTAQGTGMAGLPPEMLRQLRALVKHTENVGRRFPEEARKMHYDESPARPIRGEASAEEADALRDEGIEFALLPTILTEEMQ